MNYRPRVVNYFDVAIAESPYGAIVWPAASVVVETFFRDMRFKPGEAVPLRFKINDTAAG